MTRKSLRPQLNQIRAWVRQGRTDAWIAHQLEVTVQQIQVFKREQGLEPSGDLETPVTAGDYDDEIDLRAADEALIAAELEAAQAEAAELDASEADDAGDEGARDDDAGDEASRDEGAGDEGAGDEASSSGESGDDGQDRPARRRRTRRGGSRVQARGRRRPSSSPLEATFEHGEEGYGLWLDPEVQDDPVYAEYWAGHRPVEVTIEEDQIVIRRAGGEGTEDDE